MKDLTPQQLQFKEFYCNPESETFGNALQSALRAGYKQEYAESITSQGTDWFSEIIREQTMKVKAEKVLDEILDMNVQQVVEGKNGNSYIKIDTGILKVKQDTAKFISERLNKEKYSSRTEVTGKNGGAIEVENKKLDSLIVRLEETNKNQYEANSIGEGVSSE